MPDQFVDDSITEPGPQELVEVVESFGVLTENVGATHLAGLPNRP
ncbi:hypothetical protein ACSJLP_28015 [Gordonia rhizosphera NBRC 16068]